MLILGKIIVTLFMFLFIFIVGYNVGYKRANKDIDEKKDQDKLIFNMKEESRNKAMLNLVSTIEAYKKEIQAVRKMYAELLERHIGMMEAKTRRPEDERP